MHQQANRLHTACLILFLNKPNACGSESILPTEFRVIVVRARQHVEACECSRRGISYQGRRPTQLLQITGAVS